MPHLTVLRPGPLRPAPSLLLLAAAFGSCQGRAPDPPFPASDTGGGTTPSLEVLAGSWSGLLWPEASTEPLVIALGYDESGQPVEAWLGDGASWLPETSELEANLDPGGSASILLQPLLPGAPALELRGPLGPEGLPGGWFRLETAEAPPVEGVFELQPTGPGFFSVGEHLAGRWTGFLDPAEAHRRPSVLTLSADGGIPDGRFGEKAADEDLSEPGLVSFADADLGRVEDFCVWLEDGTHLRCDFLLVDPAGEWLQGDGWQEQFGAFQLTLARVPEASLDGAAGSGGSAAGR